MTIQTELHRITEIADAIDAQVRKDGALSDADAQRIVHTMQAVEDKLASLLADFGIETGDERVD